LTVLPLDFYGFALRILTNLPFFVFFQGSNFLSLWQARKNLRAKPSKSKGKSVKNLEAKP